MMRRGICAHCARDQGRSAPAIDANLADRIEGEPFRFVFPSSADEFVWREAFERLQPARVVVGCDELAEMLSQVIVRLVMVSLDGSFLQRSVHAFHLAVGPWMPRLGKPVIDVGLSAGIFKSVRPDRLIGLQGTFDLGGGRADVAGCGEVWAVVCKHCMDPIWHRLDECAEEVCGCASCHLLVQLGDGELRSSVDGNEQIELPLFRSDFGEVDMEVADRVDFEALLSSLRCVWVGQTGDAVALQASMQRRAGEVGQSGLKGILAIVERQQGVLPESDDNGLILG